MQPVSRWITRAKWLLVFALLIWGAYFFPTAYADCRAAGHNNVGCAGVALLTAYFSVLFHGVAAVTAFLAWVLP